MDATRDRPAAVDLTHYGGQLIDRGPLPVSRPLLLGRQHTASVDLL